MVFRSIHHSSTGFFDGMEKVIDDLVSRMLASVRHRRSARKDQQNLERYSARILKDIGLYRSEIHEAVWYTGPARYVCRR